MPTVLLGTTLVVHATTYRESVTGQARGVAVDTVNAWVRDNVPPGATVAFGSFLGYEMGNELVDQYSIVQLAHVVAEFDPSAPEGLRQSGQDAFGDWIAVDTAPKNTNEFQAFRAGTLRDRLQALAPDWWVYTTGITTAPPTILALLTPAAGFDEVATWSFATSARALEVHIFRVHLDRIDLDPGRIALSPAALSRFVTLLDRAGPAAAATIARRLLDAEVVPHDATTAALLARLKLIAGGS